MVETADFLTMLRRMLAAAGRRVADADEHELAALLALRGDLDKAVQVAIDGQRSIGRSWADIGLAAGMTRQAAHERWSRASAGCNPI